MGNNIVSIIMSVCGYENYIEETIESVLSQTFEDFEFIIIDDDCKYDLGKKLKAFNDDRVCYIKNDHNIGLTKSLLKAINFSKGKYMAIQDAGNISLKHRIETQYNFLENNKDYYLIGSSVVLIDEAGEEICKLMANSNLSFIKKNLPKRNCIKHSSIMFRNKGNFFYRSKFKYAQDYDFYLCLLSNNKKIGNIPDVLLKERFICNSISFSKKMYQEYFADKAREFYIEREKYRVDSYCMFNPNEVEKNNLSNKKFDCLLNYNKEKIHYLLFSEKFKIARKIIKEALHKCFDVKLVYYLFLSYLPFLVRFLIKIKKINYK